MSLHFSYRLVNEKRKLSSPTTPIYMRVRDTVSKKEKVFNTGVRVDRKFWKNGYISTKSPNYTSLHNRLDLIKGQIETLLVEFERSGKSPTPGLLVLRYKEGLENKESVDDTTLSYDEAWTKFLNKKKIETTYLTFRMYSQLHRRLDEFSIFIGRKLTFEYIGSDDFETEYKNWSWNERNHSNSFVRKNLTTLKSFLNYVERNGYSKVRFRPFQKPKTLDKREVIHLTREEVIKLSLTTKYDYKTEQSYRNEIVIINDVDRRGRIVHYTNWEVVKDIFTFMCVVGCRWNDIHYLTWDSQNFDNETFTWRNQKTKKQVTIPLDDIGINILRKYGKNKSRDMILFPTYSNVKFNKQLKNILKDLNFNRLVSTENYMGTKLVDTQKKPLYEVISSHAGRRTFIMGLINKGLGYKEIMNFSGHSDVKSLMKYISVSEGSIEKGRNLFSGTEDKMIELHRLFSQLEENKKTMVLDLVRSLM